MWMMTATALANGTDAHGPVLPPAGADPSATLLAPHFVQPGVVETSLVLEEAIDPLVEFQQEGEGGEPVRSRALGDALLGNLGVQAGVHEYVGFGLTAPIVLTSFGDEGGRSGPTAGDLHLFGFGAYGPLRATSFLTVPTGNDDRFLGDGGWGGGGLGGLHVEPGPLLLDGHVGFEVDGIGDFGEVATTLQGGIKLRSAIGIGTAITDDFAVFLEGRAETQTSGFQSFPAELVATGRARVADGTVVAGLGRSVSPGIGAATVRAFAGLSWAFGRQPDVLTPTIVDDTTPEPKGRTVTVTDADGQPIRDAVVTQQGETIGVADHRGIVALPMEGKLTDLLVQAPGFVPTPIEVPRKGDAALATSLSWAPQPLMMRVVGQDGAIIEGAEVLLIAPDGTQFQPRTSDELGALAIDLGRGSYQMKVTAPGMGTQLRKVEVTDDHADAIDVVLAPSGDGELEVRVVDATGTPVDNAWVELDGLALGTTGSGGDIVVSGVAGKELTVRSAGHAEATVKVDGSVAEVVLGWLPGSVKVVATGPDGEVTDALALFRGPASLAPVLLGDDGERVFVLRPGTWTLLISSPSLGTQERTFTVSDQPELLVVEVVLQPEEAGDSDIGITVVDADGVPVRAASVLLDGASLGTTSTEGSLLLRDLQAGVRKVRVEAPDLAPWDSLLKVVEGRQDYEAALGWLPNTVVVTARDAAEAPIDALLRASGPAEVPPTPLGADGRERFRWDPGPWDVLLSSPEHGTQGRSVEVGEALTRIDVRIATPESGIASLDVTVTGCERAEVLLDGLSMGWTADGRLTLEQLVAGKRKLEVRAEGFQSQTRTVRLPDVTETSFALEYAPGAVLATVMGPDGPVTDAVLRAAGPRLLPPLRVDAEGRRLLPLGPGTWQVLVSSPLWGMAQHDVVVTEEDTLREETLDIGEVPADTSVLLVQVRDEDGNDVSGVNVVVGEQTGSTSAGGAFLASDLPPGPTQLVLTPPGPLLPLTVPITLEPGSQRRTLELAWPRLPLTVSVTDTEGTPIADARVSLEGPSPVASGSSSTSFEVRPGKWRVQVRAEGYGASRKDVEVVTAGVAVDFQLEPARVELVDGEIRIDSLVFFSLDSAELRPDADPILTEVASLLGAEERIAKIEVQGHTDDTGGTALNMALSQKRAEAVRAALIGLGVGPERMVARGYGLMRPIADNATDKGRARNRRVEFAVVE